jgi:hypothetical protein
MATKGNQHLSHKLRNSESFVNISPKTLTQEDEMATNGIKKARQSMMETLVACFAPEASPSPNRRLTLIPAALDKLPMIVKTIHMTR